jgi:hypothetical protein
VRITQVTDLGWVTGERSVNRTGRRFGVYGTDLGICWDAGDGTVLVAFGDSYGEQWCGDGAGPPHADWRWNFLARNRNADLTDGLSLDEVVSREDGAAAQIIAGEPGRREHTVIPTSGICVGGQHFLHYMSIREWGGPHGWRTNHGGIAHSSDGGNTWQRPESARWINRAEGDHPFQMGAFALAPDDAEHLYLLGTRNGRRGPAFLARVPRGDVLDIGAYTYWDGQGWVRDEFAAREVMPAPVGELSVLYNEKLGYWLAAHLSEERRQIIVRSAEHLTGPWSDGEKLLDDVEYPGMYGGFLHPASAVGDSAYFLVSQWGPYNVRLLRAELS